MTWRRTMPCRSDGRRGQAPRRPEAQDYQFTRRDAVVDVIVHAVQMDAPYIGQARILHATPNTWLHHEDPERSVKVVSKRVRRSRPMLPPPRIRTLDLV